MDYVYTFFVGLAIGLVVAVFVYRNNQKKLKKYFDKADKVVDIIKNEE